MIVCHFLVKLRSKLLGKLLLTVLSRWLLDSLALTGLKTLEFCNSFGKRRLFLPKNGDFLICSRILLPESGNCLLLLSLLGHGCLLLLFIIVNFSKQTLHAVVGLETVFGITASVAGVFE